MNYTNYAASIICMVIESQLIVIFVLDFETVVTVETKKSKKKTEISSEVRTCVLMFIIEYNIYLIIEGYFIVLSYGL